MLAPFTRLQSLRRRRTCSQRASHRHRRMHSSHAAPRMLRSRPAVPLALWAVLLPLLAAQSSPQAAPCSWPAVAVPATVRVMAAMRFVCILRACHTTRLCHHCGPRLSWASPSLASQSCGNSIAEGRMIRTRAIEDVARRTRIGTAAATGAEGGRGRVATVVTGPAAATVADRMGVTADASSATTMMGRGVAVTSLVAEMPTSMPTWLHMHVDMTTAEGEAAASNMATTTTMTTD
mmetsp:Transcript_41282/g.109012  ORF Transcript_41282/g.109012 Transcript_41282/m.109012 type:complete len:235 (+) Transcript_41282:222-926(+)